MDLRRLRSFVAVAETENVSRAALRVHLSQPALSRQIQSLETELDVELFERIGRNLRLTSAGQDLLEHARKVLSEADAFANRTRALRRGNAGLLRVGATPQVLERVFPPVLKRFGARMPGVDVRLMEERPSRLSEWLLNGDLDLAFMRFQPELRGGHRPAGVISLLIVSDGSRLGSRSTIELRALAGAPLLVLTPGFGSRDLFDAACEVAQIRPNLILESSAPATILALARAGVGVAVLPTTMTLPRAGAVVQRLQQNGRPLKSDLAVHWDTRRHLASYGVEFADELAAEAQKHYGG
jgi:LysR family cyn operon transcriptional activator